MPENVIKNRKVKRLLQEFQNIWALIYFLNLANWDTETYMPKGGAEIRGKTSSKLYLIIQKELNDKYFIKLVSSAVDEENLNDFEKGIVRILKKLIDHYLKLPKEFLHAYSALTTSSSLIWAQAKQKNDFNLFSPLLKKIFTMTRQKADYLGYNDHPYDALLDEYEQDITTKDLDGFFEKIKNFLLTNYIENFKKGLQSHSQIDDKKYNIKIMRKINEKILNYFNADFKYLRLDKSVHPFTAIMSTKDVRITTRYPKINFTDSLYSTIHEYGHALYTLQHNPEIEFTPLFTESSLGLHESQSRFWENHIGKSKTFIKLILEDLCMLNISFKKYQADDFYREITTVRPSLIRTEADEVTYNLHILIRYEIERALLAGSVKVTELVELWDSKYQEYLGVKPTNMSTGILQDIHWSCGLIGYFPTYALGTVLSSIWRNRIEISLNTSLEKLINSQSGIKKIKKWLGTNIHQYGYTYPLEDIVVKVTGEKFTPVPWQKYLQKKYPVF